MRDRWSLRLLATTAVALVATVFCLVVPLLQLNRLHLKVLIVMQLERAATQITDRVRLRVEGTVATAVLPDFVQSVYAKMRDDKAYWILDRAGRVLHSSHSVPGPFMPAGAPFDPQRARFDVQSIGVTHRIDTTTLDYGSKYLHLQVMRSDPHSSGFARQARRQVGVSAGDIHRAANRSVQSGRIQYLAEQGAAAPAENSDLRCSLDWTAQSGGRLSTTGMPSELTR